MGIYSNVLAKLKQYNLKLNESDEFNIRILIDEVKLEIITYCNLNEYPTNNKNLDAVLVNLVVFQFLKNKNTSVNGEVTVASAGAVKSLNVGDFSVSYGGGESPQANSNDFIQTQLDKNYSMLKKFRRFVW